MRWLVTGCDGFIGKHLVRRLHEAGQPAWGMDLTRGHDICDGAFHQWDEPVDVIVNLASFASPAEYRQKPWETITANVVGMTNVLDFARKKKAAVIQASTVRVTEGDSHLGSNGCYVEGKRAAETLCAAAYARLHTPVSILRMASVYGPGMREDDGRVIPTMIRKALAGEDIEIFGDGAQQDWFSYVDDVIDIIVRANLIPGVTTIAAEHPMSISGLALIILALTGSSSKIVRIPREYRQAHPPDADIRTPTPLLEGLRKTVEEWRAR